MNYSLCMKTIVMVGFVLFSSNASADDVRIITPVDGNGNPIGEPQTIILPTQPDSAATGHMVDQNGNQASPDFQIPDAQQPAQVDGGGDLVPMDSQ